MTPHWTSTLIADWAAIAGSLAGVLATLGAAFVAIHRWRRWDASFGLTIVDGPFVGTAFRDGKAQPETVSWICSLILFEGEAAHIGRLVLKKRYTPFIWGIKVRGLQPAIHLPITLSREGKLDAHITTRAGDGGPFRVVVFEYGSFKKREIPFLEPTRRADGERLIRSSKR